MADMKPKKKRRRSDISKAGGVVTETDGSFETISRIAIDIITVFNPCHRYIMDSVEKDEAVTRQR